MGRPGRLATYDSNSAVPTGIHEGRTIYYVFARYPQSSGNQYPVHDLVICHGDFLNPMRGYIHLNRNIPTFGAYGDIMIRDRKMYVVRTPYDIAEGMVDRRTFILPSGDPAPEGLVAVGDMTRTEGANWWQPVATVLACSCRFRGLSICDWLPLVATGWLHKRSIRARQIVVGAGVACDAGVSAAG
jgi:hypothetical protein